MKMYVPELKSIVIFPNVSKVKKNEYMLKYEYYLHYDGTENNYIYIILTLNARNHLNMEHTIYTSRMQQD